MPYVSLGNPSLRAGFTRPIVQVLFFASCLLSLVSYYTTQQGMALYLSPWFSVVAALGIQISLVMVAWLIGFTRGSRILLVSVYVITAVVSIAFSYVSLYNWFTARERPAQVQRALYDELNRLAGQADQVPAEAAARGQGHLLALEEMASAEKTVGHISRARDADPYLDGIRQAVAQEAKSYSEGYREGSGAGVRYTAFERFARLTRQGVESLQAARRGLAEWRAGMRPTTPTEEQLRAFHAVYDGIPWTTVQQLLPDRKVAKPAPPAYASYVDRTVSSQEDLLLAFQGLLGAPGGRHIFAFLLAAFIDVIVFLVAYAAGPYFHGDAEDRWLAAAAALDSRDQQVFARDLLRKMQPGPGGIVQVADEDLSGGERQFCLLLRSRGMALSLEKDGRLIYMLEPQMHERLVETLAQPGLPLRAEFQRAAADA